MYNHAMKEAEFRDAVAGLVLDKAAFFATIGSTNDVVAEWARRGLKGLAVAAADEQTHGRGRAGRRWFTPAGSALAFSLLLSPVTSMDPTVLGRASGLGALAVCEALESLYSLAPQIKWPNDVLLNGKKTAGILAEAHWSGDHLQVLILGIGINVAPNSVPPGETINFPATCVQAVLSKAIETSELLRAVLQRLIVWNAKLQSIEFIRAWESRLAYLGQTVRLETGAKEVDAQLHGLATDGGLELRLPSGDLRVFQMGEIQISPMVVGKSK